jgi:hypothetical protein
MYICTCNLNLGTVELSNVSLKSINLCRLYTRPTILIVCIVCVCVYTDHSEVAAMSYTKFSTCKFRKYLGARYKYHYKFIIVQCTTNTSNLCQLYTRPGYSSSKTKVSSGPGHTSIWKSDGVFLIFISCYLKISAGTGRFRHKSTWCQVLDNY